MREDETPEREKYAIPVDAAEILTVCAMAPSPVRAEYLRAYGAQHGLEALAGLFGEFIGLANRLATNAADMAELLLIERGLHPYEAEKLNTPTVVGALSGIRLAAGASAGERCAGCAFRIGSAANMSPVTVGDAANCVPAGEAPFMCHEAMDARGEPIKACAGWAELRKADNAGG